MRCYIVASIVTVVVGPSQAVVRTPDPCPEGRTLERQIAAADVVVLGKVTYDRDCVPFRPSTDRVYGDCYGRRADVVVKRTWKGPLRRRMGIGLVALGTKDSAGIFWRKGETHVLFARVTTVSSDSVHWSGHTDACMLPEAIRSEKALVKQLDAWARAQRRTP